MTAKRAPFYRVIVQQGAASIDVVLSGDSEAMLFDLVAVQGRPFAVWVERPGGGAEMLYADPASAGFRYLSRPAGPIALNAAGAPLAAGELPPGATPPGKVSPDEGEKYAAIAKPGRVLIPTWQGQRTTHGILAVLQQLGDKMAEEIAEADAYRKRHAAPADEPPDRVDQAIPPNGAGAAVSVGAASFPGESDPAAGDA